MQVLAGLRRGDWRKGALSHPQEGQSGERVKGRSKSEPRLFFREDWSQDAAILGEG